MTEASAESSPLLAATGARIDADGRPLLLSLTAESRAARLGLLGDWSALFRLLSGEAELRAGSLEVDGHPAPACVQRGQVGLARLDPLLPAAWSVEQLLSTSLELSGAPREQAARGAFRTLDALGLMGLSGKRLGHLAMAERRALLLAHACSTEPSVLCVEHPLAGLDTAAQELVLAVLERAVQGRRLIVALGQPTSAGERELIARLDERLRLSAGVDVVETDQAPDKSHFTATVCRNHHAFAAALAERGVTAHPTHEAGILTTLTSAHAGPAWRYLVVLSGSSTADVLDAALATDAGLLELKPA